MCVKRTATAPRYLGCSQGPFRTPTLILQSTLMRHWLTFVLVAALTGTGLGSGVSTVTAASQAAPTARPDTGHAASPAVQRALVKGTVQAQLQDYE